MSRIEKAYEHRYRELLLGRFGARRLDQGVEWLLQRAEQLKKQQGLSPTDALTRVARDLAAKTLKTRHPACDGNNIRFFCDSGLGGLARWLRGCGYDAFWEPSIDDFELLQKAQKLSATVLTTDSLLMERRVVRDHVIPALWLPPTLSIPEALAFVFHEFGLKTREPRCMSCGGELRRESKERLKDKIPPKTFKWLDEYFVCSRCGKLFWRGTHWHKIENELHKMTSAKVK
jgi:uncharacterized protein with PIN domain